MMDEGSCAYDAWEFLKSQSSAKFGGGVLGNTARMHMSISFSGMQQPTVMRSHQAGILCNHSGPCM